MKVKAEVYKGIEYIRIFSLPEDQKEKIWETFDRSKIIKILKDKTLLSDCIQFTDYQEWYHLNFKPEVFSLNTSNTSATQQFVFKEITTNR